jgi:hypothetical protein
VPKPSCLKTIAYSVFLQTDATLITPVLLCAHAEISAALTTLTLTSKEQKTLATAINKIERLKNLFLNINSLLTRTDNIASFIS